MDQPPGIPVRLSGDDNFPGFIGIPIDLFKLVHQMQIF
jgi:hypothetical protein